MGAEFDMLDPDQTGMASAAAGGGGNLFGPQLSKEEQVAEAQKNLKTML